MTAFIQSKSAHVVEGTDVTVTLTGATTANNLIVAIVSWFKATNFFAGAQTITVKDSSLATVPRLNHDFYPGTGGDLQMDCFVATPVAGGLTSFTAHNPNLGEMFLTVHEVQPDAGQFLYLNDVAHVFRTNASTGIVGSPFVNNGLTGNRYALAAYAQNADNGAPSVTAPAATYTLRENNQNTTSIDTGTTYTGGVPFLWTGSLVSWDAVNPSAAPTWSIPANRWTAIGAVFGFISCHLTASTPAPSPVPGSFPTTESVAFTQAESLAMYYTTNGTTPTTGSTLYSGPISVAASLTIKIFAHDATAVYNDSVIFSGDYHIYTGTVSNPGNIIDGDDTTFAELDCNGSPGDVVGVRVDSLTGTLGSTGSLNVDFQVTQNNLVAAGQTIPAWKVSGFIAGVETVLASGAVGAGVVARQVVSLSVPAATLGADLKARISAACQIPGSTGGVKVRVFAADLTL